MLRKFLIALRSSFYQEQHRHFLWMPVLFGAGIAIGFELPWPTLHKIQWGLGGILIGLLIGAWIWRSLRRLFTVAIALLTGLLCVTLHTHYTKTILLTKNLYLPAFTGTVERIETANYGRRLLIQPTMKNAPVPLPQLVKLTLRGHKEVVISPGDTLGAPVKLTPIPGKVLPTGFDFRRKAFFDGIGASGFIAGTPHITPAGQTTTRQSLERARAFIAQQYDQHLPPQTGAIATALVTGSTAKISDRTRQAFASCGIAHILAISGLHLNLVGLLIFGVVRLLFCLIPPMALRHNVKKIAAACTILGLFGYLQLSGSGLPSQRAFLMALFAMLAIIIDRIPWSLRFVAIAALLILAWHPSALLTPSFQLSFAAVSALILAFEHQALRPSPPKGPKTVKSHLWHYMKGIIMTTLIASIAVIPFTIYHFHQLTLQSVLANMLAIPLMAFWIMPALLLSVMCMPVGAESVFIDVAGIGIHWLEQIAHEVSKWPGALLYITHPPTWAFILILLSLLWLAIWQQKWRLWSLPGLLIGLIGFFVPPKTPSFFISADGKYYGYIQEGVFWFSGTRRQTFTSKLWCESLGVDPKTIQKIPLKKAQAQSTTVHHLTLNAQTIAILQKDFQIAQGCPEADIVFAMDATKKRGLSCPNAKIYLDFFDLRRHGPLTLTFHGVDTPTITYSYAPN